MTSPAEFPVNGTKTAKIIDSTTTNSSSSPSSSPTTPKAKTVQKNTKTNGYTSDSGINGNGVEVSNTNHLNTATTSSPPTSSPTTTAQTEIMEQIPSIESQSEQGDHEMHDEDEAGSTGKKDLYVGNLHPRVQPHMLKDLFGGDTMVENVKIVPDRNLSHGGLAYGFVTMVSREAAEVCMQALQNNLFFGLELRINWATPTKSAEQGLSLFVGDIGPDVTLEELREAFQDADNSVTDARIVMDPTSGRTKGYGFVTFQDSEAATKALSKNGEILKGRKMRVNWASTTKDAKTPVQQFVPSPDAYGAGIVRNDVQIVLTTMASYEGLDVGWYLRLPQEIQAGIARVSNEAPGAKVVWVGNLDKHTNQIDLMPLFSPYGLVEEITMVSPNGYAFVSMASHLAAATLIVIFKEFMVKGRKIKTGWSHSTQRQLQQAATQIQQQPHPQTMIPTHPHHRAQQNLQMQPPQMTPLPPMAGPPTYMYPQQPMLYNPYMQPVHPYPMAHHPPNGTGTSTPRSTTSGGSVTPATIQSKETPSPR